MYRKLVDVSALNVESICSKLSLNSDEIKKSQNCINDAVREKKEKLSIV